MQSVYEIAHWINDTLSGVFKNSAMYGVAMTASRDGVQMPYVPDKERFIGVDDSYSFMVYHKHLSIQSSLVNNSGYGDVERFLQNTHQMAMILYFDESKCGNRADQVYTIVQSQITGVLKAANMRSIRLAVSNAVLNDGQVWTQEYGNADFRLGPSQRLIQIGYTVTMTFNNKCIPIPNCKN